MYKIYFFMCIIKSMIIVNFAVGIPSAGLEQPLEAYIVLTYSR